MMLMLLFHQDKQDNGGSKGYDCGHAFKLSSQLVGDWEFSDAVLSLPSCLEVSHFVEPDDVLELTDISQ